MHDDEPFHRVWVSTSLVRSVSGCSTKSCSNWNAFGRAIATSPRSRRRPRRSSRYGPNLTSSSDDTADCMRSRAEETRAAASSPAAPVTTRSDVKRQRPWTAPARRHRSGCDGLGRRGRLHDIDRRIGRRFTRLIDAPGAEPLGQPAWIPAKAGRHRDIEIATMAVPRSTAASIVPRALCLAARLSCCRATACVRSSTAFAKSARNVGGKPSSANFSLRCSASSMKSRAVASTTVAARRRGRRNGWGSCPRCPRRPAEATALMKSIAARRVPSFTLRASALACPCRTSWSSMI